MAKPAHSSYRVIVVGVSAGGVAALHLLLAGLPRDFALPILIVHHIARESSGALAELLDGASALRVKEAEECERICPGSVYLAPANYHLMLEADATLSLSTDAPVCFARPSVDVLFESAAQAFGAAVIGVVLTGSNADGSQGLKKIKEKGGLAIVQAPADAQFEPMPRAALAALAPLPADFVAPLAGLAALLLQLGRAAAPTPAPAPPPAATPRRARGNA
jgi:two-component system chemotaxis response regulator CheB